MKIPVTDQFLWDVYGVISKTGYVIGSTNRVPNLINRLAGMENPVFKKYRKDKNSREFAKFIYYLKTAKKMKLILF